MLERDIESYAVRYAKKLGVLTYKWASPASRGVPDRIFIGHAGAVVFVEFKAPGKKPTPLQDSIIRGLISAGANVMVIDNKEDAKRMLDAIRPA